MTTSYELARCPVCGAGEAEIVAEGEGVTREMEELWGFHLRRLRAGTPAARLHDRVVFSQDPPIQVVRCSTCGSVYRNPREHPRALVELYAGEEPDESTLSSLHQAQRVSYRRQARRLTETLGRPAAGLEVGSYVGAFLAAARDEGWDFEGVDVGEAANAYARSLGFRVTRGTLAEVDADRRYDAVAIWNCFDQLPDPRATLRSAHALLRPGGALAIRVPNGACYALLRPRLEGPLGPVVRALLAHNNLLGFPYRHGFNPGSLAWLLEAERFEVVAVLGDVLVPIADSWTQGWARMEERLVKAVMRQVTPLGAAPWFEVYARRRDSGSQGVSGAPAR